MKRYLIALAALTLSMSINAQEVYQATQTAKSITWPDLKDSYLKTGDFVSISALKSVGAGQSYEQVRLAIGNPHFSEGLGNPDEFNYAFNFYTNAEKTEWVTCQYQVTFNEHHRVDGRMGSLPSRVRSVSSPCGVYGQLYQSIRFHGRCCLPGQRSPCSLQVRFSARRMAV